jgi:hypothetical protein
MHAQARQVWGGIGLPADSAAMKVLVEAVKPLSAGAADASRLPAIQDTGNNERKYASADSGEAHAG